MPMTAPPVAPWSGPARASRGPVRQRLPLQTRPAPAVREEGRPFRHLLVPLDRSPLAECALPHAAALASAFGARVTLLSVLGPEPGADVHPVDPLEWALLRAEAREYLESARARLKEMGVESCRLELLEGEAAEQVLAYSAAGDVDLVVLSSHGGHGLSRWTVASLAHKLVLACPVSTLLVRAAPALAAGPSAGAVRYRRILVPLDCSRRAEIVLPPAAALARRHGARLLAAHVVERPAMPGQSPLSVEEADLAERVFERNRRAAGRYLEQLRHQIPVEMEPRLVSGHHVAGSLHELETGERCDLVLVSAHGSSGDTRLPHGACTAGLIDLGSAPLLIVRDPSVSPAFTADAASARPGRPAMRGLA